jgi:hypothetical protein
MFSRIILAVALVSSFALAEQAKRPTAAERIVNDAKLAERMIAERGLVCVYGKTRFSSDGQGRLVIITSKVCTEPSR